MYKKVSTSKKKRSQLDFSFAGCGFLGIYHVGVAACLKKYAWDLIRANKISGASAGSLAACCLICDAPLGQITSSVLKSATEARRRFLGPFSPTFNVEKLLREGLLAILPDDSYLRCNGRLCISLTRVSDGKNIIVSQFDNQDELITALLASAFIPGFSGWQAPVLKGVRYIDGGFTNNLPDSPNTVTVSPFSGEADICPKDPSPGILTISLCNTSIELTKENLNRFGHILFPPKAEILSDMCSQGFSDTLEFLQRNDLISCTRCLAVRSHFSVQDQLDEAKSCHSDDHSMCGDCDEHREYAAIDVLPDTVGSILQDSIESANRGLINWIFKHPSMKIVSLLTLPWVLPIDIIYALFLKFVGSEASMTDLMTLSNRMIEFAKKLVVSSPSLPEEASPDAGDGSGQFSCQFSITEFSGSGENTKRRESLYSRQNFDFTLDLGSTSGMPESHLDVMALEDRALAEMASRCASRLGSRCVSRSHSRNPSRVASRAPSRSHSRVPSRAVSRRPSDNDLELMNPEDIFRAANSPTPNPNMMSEESFESIIDVTTQQEAVMAFYYMDDNDQVQVTEIFDMTEVEMEPFSRRDSNFGYDADDDNIFYDSELRSALSGVARSNDSSRAASPPPPLGNLLRVEGEGSDETPRVEWSL